MGWTRTIHGPLLLVPLLLAASALAFPARADAAETEEDEFTALVRRIGKPARKAAAAAELQAALDSGPGSAIRLARAMGYVGGVSAAETLVTLLDHEDDRVRVAALEAARDVGLRSTRLGPRVRRCIRTMDAEPRAAALEALGRVGDGADVPLLMAVGTNEDEAPVARRAAFRALRTLSGLHIPYEEARWRSWWRHASGRAARELPAALVALTEAPSGPDADRHEATVRRLGWLDVRLVQQTVDGWLWRPEPELRARACRVAGALRLADLGSTIAWIGRSETAREPLVSAARDAFQALGLREPVGGQAR